MMDSLTCISDDRKIRKPLIKKKRRARINESLETLKNIILECDPESANKTSQRTAKLEKADILEMTVRYLQRLRSRQLYRIGVKSVPKSEFYQNYPKQSVPMSVPYETQSYYGYPQSYSNSNYQEVQQMTSNNLFSNQMVLSDQKDKLLSDYGLFYHGAPVKTIDGQFREPKMVDSANNNVWRPW